MIQGPLAGRRPPDHANEGQILVSSLVNEMTQSRLVSFWSPSIRRTREANNLAAELDGDTGERFKVHKWGGNRRAASVTLLDAQDLRPALVFFAANSHLRTSPFSILVITHLGDAPRSSINL